MIILHANLCLIFICSHLTHYAGLSFFNREVGDSRAAPYSRKALVAPLYTKRSVQQSSSPVKLGDVPSGGSGTRQRQIANSELRQREALEIADLYLTGAPKDGKLYQNRKGPSLVELTGGGGVVNAQNPQLEDPTQLSAAPQSGNDSQPQPLPETATITVQLSTGPRTMTVDYGKVTHLAAISEGLESEDILSSGSQPVEQWWSNVINKKGDVQEQGLAYSDGPSVALLTSASLVPDVPQTNVNDQCKIYVLDVNTEVGPTFGARACNVSYKRVWPFSRYKYGIDGVLTLPPEHYQYAAEWWISQSIRNSSRHTTSMRDADFVFVDMWCYHTAWLAYIHPLGNRNTSNPEPYMRRSIDSLLAMDR